MAWQWLPETWPAGTGIILFIRTEQRLATTHALVHSLFLVIVVLAGKGVLGTTLTGYTVLFLRQLVFPLFFRFNNFAIRHGLINLYNFSPQMNAD